MNTFTRFEQNPIIIPNQQIPWRARGAYNPAAIYLDGKVHILFRGQDHEGTSVLGYASSKDGMHIDEVLDEPIYVPRQSFEQKTKPNWNSGCEDPRITQIDDRLYMTYTAYDGTNPPRVALTSIAVSEFLAKNWNWDVPKLISPPGVDDKDSCLVKRLSGEGYLGFHRHGNSIWLDFFNDLSFPNDKFLTGGILAEARPFHWDNIKVGIAAPPIETERGWILIYHGVSDPGFIYKIGAMLLDRDDPMKVLARTNEPLLSPEMDYELNGQIPNIIYPCGAVVIDGVVYLYYGGADTVSAVAYMPLIDLLNVFHH